MVHGIVIYLWQKLNHLFSYANCYVYVGVPAFY